MLNRRLLRIKVMQTLYALNQSEQSNYHSSIDYINDHFAPDLNSMEPQDRGRLQGDTKLTISIFDRNFLNEKPQFEDASPEIIQVAEKAIKLYKSSKEKDRKYFKKLMLEEIDQLYDRYLKILLLLPALSDYISNEEEEKKSKYVKENISLTNDIRFTENKIILSLKENKELEDERIRKNLHSDYESIKHIHKNILKNDPIFQEYIKTTPGDFEEDKKIILHIIKSIIFKDKALEKKFEEEELNWVENRAIVKSMVVKTIKAVEAETPQISLMEISNNWEEDKFFFEELYSKYLDKEKGLEELVSEKTKNWDIERVALLDKIIIKLALTEMLSFPSIPTKVSINEYIELSKTYSTPKSKQFVNGVLDKITIDMTKQGLIKKSGRGLIDNK